MNVILLSGGSGKRLWPLSNDVRSKQFIQLFKTKSGTYESMLQRVYRQIREVSPGAFVTVAAAKSQVSAIRNQLGEDVSVCAEPCRRDTFPAIVLASAYLRDVKGVDPDEAVVVCPVDALVEKDYFAALSKLGELAQQDAARLMLLGIEPKSPSESYGYIIPGCDQEVSPVKAFREKPDAVTAERYIRGGALWNGGVFAYKLGWLLEKAREMIGFSDYDDLYSRYATLKGNSFDYAVTEKEKSIAVLRFAGQWRDIRTWSALTGAMEEQSIGNATQDPTCENVHVLNELDVPVLCVGLKNVVISASPEGVLVSDKEQSGDIRPFVEKLARQVMFAEKSWGSFRVLDVEQESMTVKVTLNPGHRMNYHSHERRDEVWTIISGQGRTIVDGMEQPVRPGDVITMQAGCRHTIIADTELKVIEIQLGKEISKHDKHKYELEE